MIEQRDVFFKNPEYAPVKIRAKRTGIPRRLAKYVYYGDLFKPALNYAISSTTITGYERSTAQLALAEGQLPQESLLDEVIDESLAYKLGTAVLPLTQMETNRLLERTYQATNRTLDQRACFNLCSSLETLVW